jgi:hypothetical protein
MGILKLPDRLCSFWNPESLEKNFYRGGKLTRKIKPPRAGVVNQMCVEISGKTEGAA